MSQPTDDDREPASPLPSGWTTPQRPGAQGEDTGAGTPGADTSGADIPGADIPGDGADPAATGRYGFGGVPSPYGDAPGYTPPPPPSSSPPSMYGGVRNPYEAPSYSSYETPPYGASPGEAGPYASPYSGSFGVPYGAAYPGADSVGSAGLGGFPAPRTIGGALNRAFRLFGRNAALLLGMSVLYFLVQIVLAGIANVVLHAVGLGTPLVLTDDGSITGGLGYVGTIAMNAIVGFVSGVCTLIMSRGMLTIARSSTARLGQFFAIPATWWVYALVTAGLAALGSLVPAGTATGELEGSWQAVMGPVGLLLIVVSVVLSIGLCYFAFALLDEPSKPGLAIASSFRLVGKGLGSTVGYLVVGALLTVAGLLACLVGIVVVLPIVMLGLASLYCGLRGDRVAAE